MATIKDVAKMAGVSVSTVSKYINGGNVRAENVESIRRAISELDYRVNPFARNLKSQQGRSIGILLPDMTAPFYGTLLTSIDKVLRENGYHSLISCYGSNYGLERDNLQFLISNGIDGLIYAPEDLSSDEFYEIIAKCSIPVVQIDRLIPGIAFDAVLVDNSDAVYQAVSRLIEKGHRRVGIISGPKSVFTARERLAGYLKALSDHNIVYDDELVISGDNVFGTGYHGCDTLLRLADPPTAVFTTNYNITIGLVTAVRERTPQITDGMDIFGFDCVEICTMLKPPLPVVHQPEQEIGQTAANYLIQRLKGYHGNPRTTRLKCMIEPK